MIAKITENSYVTVGLMTSILLLAFSAGTAWARLEEVLHKQQSYEEVVRKIDTRLSHLEGAMGIKGDQ